MPTFYFSTSLIYSFCILTFNPSEASSFGSVQGTAASYLIASLVYWLAPSFIDSEYCVLMNFLSFPEIFSIWLFLAVGILWKPPAASALIWVLFYISVELLYYSVIYLKAGRLAIVLLISMPRPNLSAFLGSIDLYFLICCWKMFCRWAISANLFLSFL